MYVINEVILEDRRIMCQMLDSIDSVLPIKKFNLDRLNRKFNFQVQFLISYVTRFKNFIVRQSTRKRWHGHMIAANVDQALLIVTLTMPRTSLP